MTSAFFPSDRPTIAIVTVFVAGPARRKAKAAPGFNPFSISDAAIGIDPDEQIYIGVPIKNITIIAVKPDPR